MKWFDLRSWAFGLLVGGLLVSVQWQFQWGSNDAEEAPLFEMGKYQPEPNLRRDYRLYSILFRDDGVAELEISERVEGAVASITGKTPEKLEAYVGMWKFSDGLILVEADVRFRYPPPKLIVDGVVGGQHSGHWFKLKFRPSRSNPDSPAQLILVKRHDQDLLRRDFETWKWVED